MKVSSYYAVKRQTFEKPSSGPAVVRVNSSKVERVGKWRGVGKSRGRRRVAAETKHCIESRGSNLCAPMSYDIRNIKGRKGRANGGGSSSDREEEGEGGVRVAKRDAVIRRYWQFSRSITGTRKEKILRLKFIEGAESERAGQGRGKEKKVARDAGDREKPAEREKEREGGEVEGRGWFFQGKAIRGN